MKQQRENKNKKKRTGYKEGSEGGESQCQDLQQTMLSENHTCFVSLKRGHDISPDSLSGLDAMPGGDTFCFVLQCFVCCTAQICVHRWQTILLNYSRFLEIMEVKMLLVLHVILCTSLFVLFERNAAIPKV